MRFHRWHTNLLGCIIIVSLGLGNVAPAQARATATALSFTGPIVITQGGTYSGNWQSLDANVPAVTIKTSAPVIIENATIQSRGTLIDAYSAFIPISLTVRNTSGYGLNPDVAGKTAGKFVDISEPVNITIEHCYLEGTAGISLYDGAQYQSIHIRYNRSKNMDGRVSNESGGYTGSSQIVHFVHFNHVGTVPGAEIAWNEVINAPYQSAVEDNINIQVSGGTASAPLLIHDNYIQGAYSVDPAHQGYSGSGILLGDSDPNHLSASFGFVHAYNNQVISADNMGIGIGAGHDSEIDHNRVVMSGLLPNGARIFGWVTGIAVFDYYQTPTTFYNDRAHDNVIGVFNYNNQPTGSRNDTSFVDCAPTACVNNTSLPDPITPATEQNEYQIWQQKVAQNSVILGPATAPTTAPANVKAIPDAQQHIDITWGAVPTATSYNLYRGTTAGGEGQTPFKAGLIGTSFTNTTVTLGATYTYQVSAVNAAGESPRSAEVSVMLLAAGTPTVATGATVTTTAPAVTATPSTTHARSAQSPPWLAVLGMLVALAAVGGILLWWRRRSAMISDASNEPDEDKQMTNWEADVVSATKGEEDERFFRSGVRR